MNIESESDQNIIIPQFTDCQGTCKTPIGCTCDNAEDDNTESEVVENKELAQQTLVNLVTSIGGKTQEVTIAQADVAKMEEETKAVTKEAPQVKKVAQGCCSKRNGNCCAGANKLEVYDWMADMPPMLEDTQMVEVQFKNTRKSYYLNSNNIEVYKGDIVAVEALPGHDIGEVTMTGKLVQLQMRKMNFKGEVKRVYRIAKPNDIEKYEEAKKKEHKTMLRAREMAEELQLNMKISDVEFQGDGNKAIFYYIADDRVDFRQLIKVYASEFRVKIEMKQIGARQEAGRVGGIGPCGRELCCSSSMSNFVSVSTSAARLQEIPLNPQKLAGQCGKLKCCLNFEVDTYVEAQRQLPPREMMLETKDASYFNFKTDVLSGTMIYSTDKHFAANLVTLNKERVFEIIKMNKRGEKPLRLQTDEQEQIEKPVSHDLLDQGSITRFDTSGGGGNRNKKKKLGGNRPDNQAGQAANQAQAAPRRENERPKLNKATDGAAKESTAVQPATNQPRNAGVANNRPNNNNNRKELRPNNNVNADRPAGEGGDSANRPNNNNQQRRNNRNNRNRPQRSDNNNNNTTESPKNDA